jgi:hypothetical protein
MAASVTGPKPFVQIACVCEKVLIEPDNVPSLIRVVDTYLLNMPPELPTDLKVGMELTAFISLKSGDVIGESEIGLRLVTPDEAETALRMWPVEFGGGEHGVNLKIGFGLEKPQFGLYWFDVLWKDEVLTRIPFRLKPRPVEPTVPLDAPTETMMRSK